ncbi:MAG: hypothetical protein KJ844_08280 [Candidatus Edwardsbacteria bacterium]|nr:hypothetical protein [Candidatus Edwardsbacteria bacterium]
MIKELKDITQFIYVIQNIAMHDSACTIKNLNYLFGPHNEYEIDALDDSLNVKEINKRISNPKCKSVYLLNFKKHYWNIINPSELVWTKMEREVGSVVFYTITFINQKRQTVKYVIGKEPVDGYYVLSHLSLNDKELLE